MFLINKRLFHIVYFHKKESKFGERVELGVRQSNTAMSRPLI